MSKTLLCRCEDVTLSDVRECIERGMRDVESIKRYLGVGTGPCQAKGCMVELAFALIAHAGADPKELKPIAPRQPIVPIPLRFFAGDDPDTKGNGR